MTASRNIFSDGIADDIITELSRSRSLFVIARNSSFTYKGRAVDVKQVGARTGRALRGRGQRAAQRRPRPDHRAAHRCGDRQSHLGRTIRSRCGRGLRGPGRDHAAVTGPSDRLSPMRSSGARCASRQKVLAPGRPISGGCGIWSDATGGRSACSGASSTAPSNSTLRFPPRIRDWRCCSIVMARCYAYRPLLEALRLSEDEARNALEFDPTEPTHTRIRAYASGSLGNYAAGFDDAELALSLNPNCALAYTSRVGYLSFRPARRRT